VFERGGGVRRKKPNRKTRKTPWKQRSPRYKNVRDKSVDTALVDLCKKTYFPNGYSQGGGEKSLPQKTGTPHPAKRSSPWTTGRRSKVPDEFFVFFNGHAEKGAVLGKGPGTWCQFGNGAEFRGEKRRARGHTHHDRRSQKHETEGPERGVNGRGTIGGGQEHRQRSLAQ